MTDTTTPTPPIQVKDSAAKVLVPEALKLTLMLAAAWAVDHALSSDVTRTAALAAITGLVGIVAAFVWGLRQRFHTWVALKFLANKVPDKVAVVGKPS